MFIRIKSRKNKSGTIKQYAYLVNSKRRKSSKRPPKQKIIAYLGQVIHINNNQQQTTINERKQLKTIFKEMLIDLLTSNGFKIKNKDILTKNEVTIDLSKKQVINANTGQNLCLKVNEGFITNYTLKKLFSYKPKEATEREVGLDFAKILISAGLKPSEKDFLALYTKISKGFHRK